MESRQMAHWGQMNTGANGRGAELLQLVAVEPAMV